MPAFGRRFGREFFRETAASRSSDAKEIAVESLSIRDVIEFSTERRIRKALFKAPHLICEMVCYEPGQGTAMHQHPRQDEMFYIIEGKGAITVEDETIVAGPGKLVMVPAQKRHGFQAAEDSRWVMMFIKGPGTSIFDK